MKYFKLKFLLIFAALAMAIPPAWAGTVTDVITAADLPAPEVNTTNFTYTAFTDKHFTSDALYSGNTANYKGAIVFNNNNSNKGIFTTVSGGKVKSVTIEWYSGTANDRKMQFFGKNEAYTSIGDLYSTSSSVQGTKIAEIQMSDNNLTQTVNIEGDYQYIGIRCSKSATNVNKITIVWETEGGDEPPTTDPTLKIGTESLTINDSGTNNSFTVKGENLVDNIGVTPVGFEPTLSATVGQPRDRWDNDTHYFWFERDGENVDGTVAVNYTGTELYAEGTITMGTKPYEGAPDEEDITKTVNVTYIPDIYIIGDFGEGWVFNDASRKMTFDGTTYTATVEIPANSYFVFARKLNETGLWDDGRSYFGPSYNDWPVNGTVTDQELDLNNHNVFKVNNAGEYIITINPETKTFSITSSNVANLTEANAYTTGKQFKFNGRVVVTYRQGKNLWIRDIPTRGGSTTAGYIYNASNGADFAQGDALKAGWTATKSVYNGLDEFTSAAGLQKDGEADCTPEVLTAINPATDVNKYVEFKGVSQIVDTEGNVVPLRDQFNTGFTFEEGKTYDIVGIVSYYNGLQFYPIKDLSLNVSLESDTKIATVGETIPVTVTVENAEGDYTVTYKFGENGTENTLTGNVINVTSETAGTVELFVTVTNNGATATTSETYTFRNPDAPLATDFVLVTNISQLEDGKQIIIADKNTVTSTTVLGTNQKANNRGVANCTVVEGLKIIANDDTEIMTLEKDGDYWYLRARKTAGYLYAPGGDNYLRTEGERTTNAQTSISIADDNIATIEFNTAADQRYLRYNSTSDLYSCYKASSNMKPVYIYVEKPSAPVPVDPELAFDEETPTTVYVGDVVTLTVNNVPEGATLSFTCDPEGAVTFDEETGKATFNTAGNVTITANTTATDEYTTGTVTCTIMVNDVVEAIAAPTFAPAAGTYTEAKEVAIACATPGVTITYAIDGVDKGEYNGPFTISDGEHTVTATAKMGTRTIWTPATNSATYVINAVPAANIADNYYNLQNKAEEVAGKYANVAGRRTLNFVADADNQAGTVFRIKTDPDTIGQVETLRSQAVDLQGYANRAMAYVPKVIEVVLNKLATSSLGDPETPGDGILGENGLDLILKKFYEKFDYNLYIEGTAESGYRIYGKTPSMQHVVDFYHENTAQVEAKLPMLEGYINQVLDKIRNRIPAPYNANVVVPFSLKAVRDRIAEKNGITLIDPVDNDSKMEFYRQVLNNKEYVWDFAYQTAMMYVDVIKETETYKNLPDEYKLYVTKMEKVRPDTKYYIIERGNELDYISENNIEIINNDPRTLWTLEERKTFKLNSAGELFGCPLATNGVGGYFTTNYTDFAYTLPDGVTAYKVTGVNEDGEAQLEALTGTIPAQTPVLLVAKEDGAYEVTLTTDAGTAVGTNELKGPDYLITEYQIKTPIVVQLFSLVQGFLSSDQYNTYIKPYEYLQLRYSGTVNNKYFWNVNSDLNKLQGDCIVRSLATDENGDLAFSDHWTTENNKAFLVSEDYDVITLPSSSLERGDVNHDGEVNIKDVTDLIDRLLKIEGPACPYCSDVNRSHVVDISDVTALIDILLGVNGGSQATDPDEGEGE